MTDINAKTELYCVIGDPVSHSMSPLIHNLAFGLTGYNGVYTAFQVKDVENAINGFRSLGIRGASVTIPHKVSVIDHLDEIDLTSEKIGAVNTIINEDGFLKGSNTDCEGAIKALSEKTALKDKQILIFGAGGAARAIGYGVIKNGGRLTITNRTESKGIKLAESLSCNFAEPGHLKTSDFDVLINTTSLGMNPDIDSTPVKTEDLTSSHVVMDIVYNPLKTKFLKDAQEKGCKTVDGISMFVNQAKLQFELWTGIKAPYKEMYKKVKEELERR